MKKLYILISIIIFTFIFSACSNKNDESYNLAFINSSDANIINYSKTLENYTTIDLHKFNTSPLEYLNSIEDISLISNIIIFDESFNDELASEFLEIIKPYNIPIAFALCDISEEVINSYDKAYNFKINYTYMGEILASIVDNLWTNGNLDTNSSKLLEFSVIGYDNQSENEKEMYSSFLKNIELLGIPYSVISEDYIFVSSSASTLIEEQTKSELVFILNNELLNYVYPSYTSASPIVSHNFSTNNPYSENINILSLDYTDIFTTSFKIFENIENALYPFEDITLHKIGKTIYLNPKI